MSPINFSVIDAADSSLNKTAVLVTGEHDAVIVDAAFTRADGHRIVAAALDAAKDVTTVLITGGDPDFYFGAEVIADAFPDARFVAPADVIEHIHHTYEKKLGAWARLGNNLPTRLVEISASSEPVQLDGHALQLRRGRDELGDRAWYVFEPDTSTLLGGVLLFQGLHVWTADTPKPDQRAAWLQTLDEMEALDPRTVVAGHRTAAATTDLTAIHHTRSYLTDFERIVAAAPDAASAERELNAVYPREGLKLAATIGTKVAKGEMTWG